MSLERPVEVELKYRVRDAMRGEQLLASGTLGPFRAAGSAPSLQFEDRYLDTRDAALARAGFAARLRHSRSLFIVTVKSLGGGSGALQRRTELEGPAIDSGHASDWPPSPARSLILELCGDAPLEERVTIRQLRRRRRLVAGTAIVELSLDEVDVVANETVVEQFLELEAELLAGDESVLDELREALDRDPGLDAAPGSKLESAIEAVARSTGQTSVWADVVLGRPMPFVQERGWEMPAQPRADPRFEPRGEPRRSEPFAVTAEPAAPVAPQSALPEPDAPAPTVERMSSFSIGPIDALEADVAEPEPDGLMEPPPEEVLADNELLRAEPEPLEPELPPELEYTPPPPSPAQPDVDLLQENLVEDLIDVESELVASDLVGSTAEAMPAEVAEPPTEAMPTAQPGPPEHRPRAPTEAPPRSPGVSADDPMAEAGRKVLRFHFLRLVAREPGTRSGKDPEDLHAMRVATRRLRAAWRVFGDAYKGEERKRQVAQLRDVATRLGAVRDLDVLLIGLEEYRQQQPDLEREAVEALAVEWRRRRDGARVQLLRELDSNEYQRFLTDLRTFVETPGAGTARLEPTIPHRVRDTAASRIWNAYEQVRAFEPILRWADVPTLHELRLRAKWLRYSMEFIREALGPETPILIQRVVGLQDHLGLMNDADVSVASSRAFLVQRAVRLSEYEAAAIGRYLVSRERDVVRLRANVATPWRAVASPQFRRALGRAIATL